GFTNEQYARCDVPGREHQLPERLISAGRYVGEVERRGTDATHAGRLAHGSAEAVQVGIELVAVLEWEAGGDESLERLGDRRDTNRLAIAPRPTSRDDRESLARPDVQDRPCGKSA